MLERRPLPRRSGGQSFRLLVHREVENLPECRVLPDNMLHADDPVRGRVVRMLVAAQEAPVPVRPRHVEDRAQSTEDVRAHVALALGRHDTKGAMRWPRSPSADAAPDDIRRWLTLGPADRRRRVTPLTAENGITGSQRRTASLSTGRQQDPCVAAGIHHRPDLTRSRQPIRHGGENDCQRPPAPAHVLLVAVEMTLPGQIVRIVVEVPAAGFDEGFVIGQLEA